MDSLSPLPLSQDIAQRDLKAALARVDGHGLAFRKEAVQVLKAYLEAGRSEIEQKFRADSDGAACSQALGRLMDEIVVTLFEIADRRVFPAANPTTGERVALAAIGGYGRGPSRSSNSCFMPCGTWG